MTQVDAVLLALVERAMEEWENDQEAPGTESCAQHIVAALRAIPPEAGVRERNIITALSDLADWCNVERHKLGGVDGYDYRSGEEFGIRRVEIQIGKISAALRSSPPPTAGREAEDKAANWLTDLQRPLPPGTAASREAVAELSKSLVAELDKYWSGNAGPSLSGIMLDWRIKYKNLFSLTPSPSAEPVAWQDGIDLLREVQGYARANTDAARTQDEQDTWRAHWRNVTRAVDLLSAVAARPASPPVSEASLSFICPKCGTRGITDGNASTVSDASREALAKALVILPAAKIASNLFNVPEITTHNETVSEAIASVRAALKLQKPPPDWKQDQAETSRIRRSPSFDNTASGEPGK